MVVLDEGVDKVEDNKEVKVKKGKGKIWARIIFVVVILVVIAGAALFFSNKFLANKPEEPKEELTNSIIYSQLKASSELTTAKVDFMGIAEYKDGGIPVINQGNFAFSYKATVRAGINLSEVNCEVDNNKKKVIIYIPKAQILDVKIHSDSLKFYNGSFSLFNSDEKEDTTKAMQMAEEQSKTDALETGILDLANKQSETLVKGILEDIVKDYSLECFTSKDEYDKKKVELATENTYSTAVTNATETTTK